jgi:probable rRNA maturation factor
MAQLVDIVIEDARWDAFGLAALAESAARAALIGLRLDPERFEISLMACDDTRIAVLNADFRGKPVATNVLSWPSEERSAAVAGADPAPPVMRIPGATDSLGDIAIAWETCAAEAAAAGRPMADHVTHLIVHGVLHLLGYDHTDDADAALMEAHEVRILATLGVSDPY